MRFINPKIIEYASGELTHHEWFFSSDNHNRIHCSCPSIGRLVVKQRIDGEWVTLSQHFYEKSESPIPVPPLTADGFAVTFLEKSIFINEKEAFKTPELICNLDVDMNSIWVIHWGHVSQYSMTGEILFSVVANGITTRSKIVLMADGNVGVTIPSKGHIMIIK